MSKPKTFLSSDKRLAQRPGLNIEAGERVPHDDSQPYILGLVSAPSRLEEHTRHFAESPGPQPEVAEAVEDLAEDMRVTAPRCEVLSFAKKRSRLVLRISPTSEKIYDLGAYGRSLREVLRHLQELRR